MWTLYSVKPCCDSLKEAFFFTFHWNEQKVMRIINRRPLRKLKKVPINQIKRKWQMLINAEDTRETRTNSKKEEKLFKCYLQFSKAELNPSNFKIQIWTLPSNDLLTFDTNNHRSFCFFMVVYIRSSVLVLFCSE